MTISISVERGADKTAPLYRQIAEQVEQLIESGRLATGTRLPTVRQLAADLGVTVVTVQNAYSELQEEGLAEAVVGRGTFVTRPAPSDFNTIIGDGERTTDVMANMVRFGRSSRELYPMAQANSGVDLSPAAEFFRCFSTLEGEADSLLRYGRTQGCPVLRGELCNLLASRGLDSRPDELIVTQGVTQALDLLLTQLCKPGDTVLVEEPSYLGLLGLLELHDVTAIGVPLDSEGPDLTRLKCVLRGERPRFFYTTATFQNPTGLCMSEQRRRDLLVLAEDYDLLIVEDDIYRDVELTDAPPPPLKAMPGGRERVIYVDGFAKSLMPGLRIGYMMPPPDLHAPLLDSHRLRTLCGPVVMQAALTEFLRRGARDRHLERVLPIFRERREALLGSLAQHMPEGTEWSDPAGGLCVWMTLPEGACTDDTYRAALAAGVAVAPGDRFMPRPTARGHLRLSLGAVPAERMPDAAKALAGAIRQALEAGQHRRVEEAVPLV